MCGRACSSLCCISRNASCVQLPIPGTERQTVHNTLIHPITHTLHTHTLIHSLPLPLHLHPLTPTHTPHLNPIPTPLTLISLILSPSTPTPHSLLLHLHPLTPTAPHPLHPFTLHPFIPSFPPSSSLHPTSLHPFIPTPSSLHPPSPHPYTHTLIPLTLHPPHPPHLLANGEGCYETRPKTSAASADQSQPVAH